MYRVSIVLEVALRPGPRVRGPTLRLRVPAFGTDTRALNELDVVMAAVTEAIAAYRCVLRGVQVRARSAGLNPQCDRASLVGSALPGRSTRTNGCPSWTCLSARWITS